MKKGMILNIIVLFIILVLGIYLIIEKSSYELSNNMYYGMNDTMYNKEYLYEDEELLASYDKYKEELLKSEDYQNYLIEYTSCKKITDSCFKKDLELNHDTYISDDYVQMYLKMDNYYNEINKVILSIGLLLIFEILIIIFEHYNLKLLVLLPIGCLFIGVFVIDFGVVSDIIGGLILLFNIISYGMIFDSKNNVKKKKKKAGL